MMGAADINWNAVFRQANAIESGRSSSSPPEDPAEVRAQPRSKEDLAFLEAALKEAAGFSYYKEVEKAVPKLQAKGREDVLAGLRVVDAGLVNEPELARDLDKVGVVGPLVELLDRMREDEEVLEEACVIMSFALGNNPRIQEEFLKAGLLKVLMARFEGEWSDLEVVGGSAGQSKLFCRHFGVLSGLVKHCGSAEKCFVEEHRGMRWLTRVGESGLTNTTESLREKLAILRGHLLQKGFGEGSG